MADNGAVRATQANQAQQRFEALYAAHHAAVFGYVMRRCVRAEDAADAIAESFLITWRRIDDSPAGEGLRPWLFGIARRVLANQRRGQRRHLALADRLQVELGRQPLPLAQIEQADGELAELRDALLTLSDDDRELLTLEVWEELSSEQIGVVLGCSPGAARTRLHRARRRLHAALAHTQAEIIGGEI